MVPTAHLRFVILGALYLACGGEQAKPAATPAVSPTAMTTAAPTSSAAAPVRVTIAAMKFAPNAEIQGKAFELKDDGSLVLDGATIAKLHPDKVEGKSGEPLFTIEADGTIVAQRKTGETLKFVGDDIVLDDGKMTVSVGDDGTCRTTFAKDKPGAPPSQVSGTSVVTGKFDHASSKKAAALAMLVVIHSH